MAAFFNPRQCSMKMLSEGQKKETLAHIRVLLITLPEDERPVTVEEPPAKRQRTAFDEFDDDNENTVEVIDKVIIYQTMSVGQVIQGI